MRKLFIALALLTLSGCAGWEYTVVDYHAGHSYGSHLHPTGYIHYTLGYYNDSYYNGYRVYGDMGYRYYYAPPNYVHHRYYDLPPIRHTPPPPPPVRHPPPPYRHVPPPAPPPARHPPPRRHVPPPPPPPKKHPRRVPRDRHNDDTPRPRPHN
jgi:hypothetical protein